MDVIFTTQTIDVKKKMKTRYKLIPLYSTEGHETDKIDFDIKLLKKSLPSTFSVEKTDNNDVYITIETLTNDDESSQHLIDCELDRLFFLTYVEVKAEMVRQHVAASITVPLRFHGSIPENIRPQEWNLTLPIQLRLWSIAVTTSDLRLKALYFFHIIELSYPSGNNQQYNDSSRPPEPLLECLLLRNLISHAGVVKGERMKTYCSYLKIPETMLHVTDGRCFEILSRKMQLLQEQAKKIIDNIM